MPSSKASPEASPPLASPSHSNPRKKPKHITILHPDLGIGGAERLILDVALALQTRGHAVTIYTSHRDTRHCFEEARDGSLDVRVRGGGAVPASIWGRFVVLCAVIRQVLCVGWVVWEGLRERDGRDKEREGEVFVVDQVAACVPILRVLGWCADRFKFGFLRRSRILFYCHFPDQLLARRDEGGSLRRLVKRWYRVPFDMFEGWAVSWADRVVANSRFTRGVVEDVFGRERLGCVSVVYPCVDTEGKGGDEDGEQLWGGKKILLSINRFERKKNIELAIKAYHGLDERERKGTRLVIAGGYDNRVAENAQYHAELDSLASSLGLQTATSKTVISALSIPDSIDVLFLLSVPSAFKQTLLSAASLLLYTPSHEHFGIVPVEAMHAGLPVLAVNTGGPLETIVEGKTGWLRGSEAIGDWTAVIRRVLYDLDEAELSGMSRNGKERVEREFSLRAMGDRLEEEIDGMFDTERKSVGALWQVSILLAALGLGAAVLAALALRCVRL